MPAAIGLHVPEPQLSHPPVHAVLQQMPDVSVVAFLTQFPEEQSAPTLQALPFCNVTPHWFVCMLQITPVLQSPLPVQVVLQAVGPHRYGSQAPVLTAAHAPFPSHLAALVCVPPAQL
jgi:hypothetical protein